MKYRSFFDEKRSISDEKMNQFLKSGTLLKSSGSSICCQGHQALFFIADRGAK
jgi:hypothetical protein